MNKLAIALAADSAATTSFKIFNTVNKLFRLSDHYPVGIMIYGNAELMGIPWESLIKVYRAQHGAAPKDKLADYGADFINFLKSSNLFSDSQKLTYCLSLAQDHFEAIRKDLTQTLPDEVKERSATVEGYIRNVCLPQLNSGFPELPELPADVRDRLYTAYREVFTKTAHEVFHDCQLTENCCSALAELVVEVLCRCWFDDYSGIVIAGFGEKQLFPALVSYQIRGIPLDGFLQFQLADNTEVSFESSAQIIPFAQGEMVHSFIQGVHPSYKQYQETYLEQLFDGYHSTLLQALSVSESSELGVKLAQAKAEGLNALKQGLNKYRRKSHIEPILSAVQMLPKDELASMAESLVNLTVLKRRISTDAETVGGPIDVAVISKGDGFIWIKRKHYFSADLNPRFSSQYRQPTRRI